MRGHLFLFSAQTAQGFPTWPVSCLALLLFFGIASVFREKIAQCLLKIQLGYCEGSGISDSSASSAATASINSGPSPGSPTFTLVPSKIV